MSGTHEHEDSAAISKRVNALIARLEQVGFLSQGEIDAALVAFFEKARPENGFKIVARAWVDDTFRKRLLENGNAALADIGIDTSRLHMQFRVVENTAEVHNLIVCTLCSCYPMTLLGASPGWYKSDAYRAKAVRDPRGVLEEFGVILPPETHISVWDSTADYRYMVLPRRPQNTENATEEALAAMVTRNGLIGTALL